MNLEQVKEKNPQVAVSYILNAPLEEQLKYSYIPDKLMTDEFRVLWKLFFENNMFDFTKFHDEKTGMPVTLETLEEQYNVSADFLKTFQMTDVDFFRIFLDDPMGIKMLKELALLGKKRIFLSKKKVCDFVGLSKIITQFENYKLIVDPKSKFAIVVIEDSHGNLCLYLWPTMS